MLYKSFGLFRCPICMTLRDFVAWDGSTRSVHEAECIECGHVFGYWYNEITGEKGPLLTAKVVAEGHARKMKQIREEVLSMGGRYQLFDGTVDARRRAMGES